MSLASGDEPVTLVSFIPHHDPTPCGYCKKVESVSVGMWAHFMSVTQYKNLLDRGWRRSGRYVYKPDMEKTCCPLYTIRCEAAKFCPTKSQKKVAKKVKNFLAKGKKTGSDVKSETKDEADEVSADTAANKAASDEKKIAATAAATAQCDGHNDEGKGSVAREELRVLGMKKAKIRRLERSLLKAPTNLPTGSTVVDVKDCREPAANKSLEKNLADHLPSSNTLLLNQIVNQDEEGSSAVSAHRLSLRLIKADPDDPVFMETLDASFSLFKSYQIQIHQDDLDEWSEESFTEFLADSPLAYQSRPPSGGVAGVQLQFGAYHQHYLLDGKLIAVAVLDVLPGCVSSVYFYYDPQYSHLSLGTYSALREIQLTEQLGLKYYYLGYYIHSCHKMRYKGRYRPSDLLSPVSFTWHAIQDCLPLLDVNKYSTFFNKDDPPGAPAKPDLRRVKLFLEGTIVAYNQGLVHSLSRSQQAGLKEFLELCGNLAENIVPVITS